MGCHLVLTKRKLWSALFVLFLLFDHLSCRRGGGGGFGGRGSSGARMSSSRGSSGARTGGGTYSRGGYNPGGGGARTGGSAGTFGGAAGGAYHNHKYDDRSKSSGGWFGGGKQSRPSYTKSGVGSMVRSNTFKNAIVGAAAGYLTYKAGKAIIRHAVAPMMWNNRPYYWGSNYYRHRHGQTMCRMPIDGNDQQFGNIYFPDNTRPREIVWGCGVNEHCCGYECCPYGGGGYGGGGYYGGSGRHWGGGIGLGTILMLLMLCACGGFIVHQLCKTRRATSGQSLFGGGGSWFGGTKYTPGQQATPNEPPPQYEPSGTANFTYPPPPPGNNYAYPATPKM